VRAEESKLVSELNGVLLGKWRSDPADEKAIELYGDVSLEFTERGELLYTVHAPDKDQVILLKYRLENGALITDQPSGPREERTRYFFDPDGKLRLCLGGKESIYIRDTTYES
jgi:hypothetical protein